MKCRECKDYIPLSKVKGLCDWGAFCVETKPENDCKVERIKL